MPRKNKRTKVEDTDGNYGYSQGDRVTATAKCPKCPNVFAADSYDQVDAAVEDHLAHAHDTDADKAEA